MTSHPVGARRQYPSARIDVLTRQPRKSPPGTASDLFWFLDDLMRFKQVTEVVLYVRVSERDQERRRTYLRQIRWCRQQLEKRGIKVFMVLRETRSGYLMQERLVFQWALEVAAKRGCPLVAETTDRLLRSSKYRSDIAPHAFPSVFELFRFAQFCRGVFVATILHPDTHWKEVRAHQTSRGMKSVPCAVGGKKARRLDAHPRVLARVQAGESDRVIAAEEGVARSNVQRWRLALNRVFPRGLPSVSTLEKDLTECGVRIVDDRGHRLDFHALRHTFASLLAEAGVPELIRRKLVRHATAAQTDRYTDERSIPLTRGMAQLAAFLPSPIASLKVGNTCPKPAPIGQNATVALSVRAAVNTLELAKLPTPVQSWESVAMVPEGGLEPPCG